MAFQASVHAKAIELIRLAIEMTTAAGSGHPTSAASLAHIVTVLMYHHMRYDPATPDHPTADRLVLSEGHACPIIYAAAADLGIAIGHERRLRRPMTREDTLRLRDIHSELDGHPNPAEGFPFFPAATGSLGQGLSVAAGLALAARQGRGKVTFVPSESLQALGTWAAQLLTTSTGKEGLGLVPVVYEALGTPEGCGTDRVFVSLRLAKDEDAAGEKQLAALEQAGHPVVHIAMPDVIGLGAECFRWQVAAATAGAIVGADPL